MTTSCHRERRSGTRKGRPGYMPGLPLSLAGGSTSQRRVTCGRPWVSRHAWQRRTTRQDPLIDHKGGRQRRRRSTTGSAVTTDRPWSGGLATSAALPAGPPPGDGGVQGFGLLGIELPAAGFVTLGVQPDAQLMLFAGDECLMPRPVIARSPIGDQGSEPLPPSILVGF